MDEETKVGDGASTEDTVADTSDSTITNDSASGDDPAKLKQLADNYKVRAEKAEREAKELKQKLGTKETTSQFSPDDVRKQAETAVRASLEQRDLEEMEYPDEIKTEIKRVAQIQNVSVRKAEKDPYIQSMISRAQAADRVNEAAVPRSSKSVAVRSDETPKFDMSTDEGRKAFDEWRETKRK